MSNIKAEKHCYWKMYIKKPMAGYGYHLSLSSKVYRQLLYTKLSQLKFKFASFKGHDRM